MRLQIQPTSHEYKNEWNSILGLIFRFFGYWGRLLLRVIQSWKRSSRDRMGKQRWCRGGEPCINCSNSRNVSFCDLSKVERLENGRAGPGTQFSHTLVSWWQGDYCQATGIHWPPPAAPQRRNCCAQPASAAHCDYHYPELVTIIMFWTLDSPVLTQEESSVAFVPKILHIIAS